MRVIDPHPLLSPSARDGAPAPLRFRHVPDWEQIPAGMTHLDAPGVAVDPQDNVYVFGRHQGRVLVYAPDGRFLRSWGEGAFKNPHGITIGPDGAVYLVDNVAHAVRKYSLAGDLLLTFGPEGTPSDTGYDPRGADVITRTVTVQRGAGPFNQPANVAVAPNGDLYVADGYGNARIHRFSPGGDYRGGWGEPGTGPGQFMLPHGIAVASDGRVLVADRENDRIQIFSPDGDFLQEWTGVQRPTQVRLDAQGRVYVSELWKRAGLRSFRSGPAPADREGGFSVFAPDGTLLARCGHRDTLAGIDLPGNFASPHDIAVDSQGSVYVSEVTYADWGSTGVVGPDCHTLQKFVPA